MRIAQGRTLDQVSQILSVVSLQCGLLRPCLENMTAVHVLLRKKGQSALNVPLQEPHLIETTTAPQQKKWTKLNQVSRPSWMSVKTRSLDANIRAERIEASTGILDRALGLIRDSVFEFQFISSSAPRLSYGTPE
eukprot:m.133151 g.133151  ORF g.133151 m.133151 type:complete len:135 (+) comp13824_c0_seq1:854-1258(+)